MELHKAIKNIIKYQGIDFVNDCRFINAVADFNGFEGNVAYKQILRIVIEDGYLAKLKNIGKYDADALNIIRLVACNYGMQESLVTYVIESCAYGMGYILEVKQPTIQPATTPSCAPKSRKQQIGDLLRSKIVFDDGVEERIQGTLELYNFQVEYSDGDLTVLCEANVKQDPEYQYISLDLYVYDKYGSISQDSGLLCFDRRKFKSHAIDKTYISIQMKPVDIAKILICIGDIH